MFISFLVWLVGFIYLIIKAEKIFIRYTLPERKILLFFIFIWPLFLLAILCLFIALSFSRVKIRG